MKTDPTSLISGAAGTPLSQHAIEAGKRSVQQPKLKNKSKIAISDTVETSDRDADGRRQQSAQSSSTATETKSCSKGLSLNHNRGDLLDLTG